MLIRFDVTELASAVSKLRFGLDAYSKVLAEELPPDPEWQEEDGLLDQYEYGRIVIRGQGGGLFGRKPTPVLVYWRTDRPLGVQIQAEVVKGGFAELGSGALLDILGELDAHFPVTMELRPPNNEVRVPWGRNDHGYVVVSGLSSRLIRTDYWIPEALNYPRGGHYIDPFDRLQRIDDLSQERIASLFSERARESAEALRDL